MKDAKIKRWRRIGAVYVLACGAWFASYGCATTGSGDITVGDYRQTWVCDEDDHCVHTTWHRNADGEWIIVAEVSRAEMAASMPVELE